uniref:Uncharacterized protein n=1 Tax=Stegastes partitus TaxID=144197 RepID=A0A3B5AQS7_9TELE
MVEQFAVNVGLVTLQMNNIIISLKSEGTFKTPQAELKLNKEYDDYLCVLCLHDLKQHWWDFKRAKEGELEYKKWISKKL